MPDASKLSVQEDAVAPTDIQLRYYFRKELTHRTNAPGTCLWCGTTLRKPRFTDDGSRGDYRDNAFCGLRCGYSFGVVLARHGERLKAFDARKAGGDA